MSSKALTERHLMTIDVALDTRASVDRLYLPRNEGERGQRNMGYLISSVMKIKDEGENKQKRKEKEGIEREGTTQAVHKDYGQDGQEEDLQLNEELIYEKRDRMTDHCSKISGITVTMVKSEYRKAIWNTSVQNVR